MLAINVQAPRRYQGDGSSRRGFVKNKVHQTNLISIGAGQSSWCSQGEAVRVIRLDPIETGPCDVLQTEQGEYDLDEVAIR